MNESFEHRDCWTESEERNNVPSVHSQQALWMINNVNPRNSAYNIPMSYQMRGPLNREALDKVIQIIIARHDVFRTTLKEEGGELRQLVRNTATLKINWIDGCSFKDQRESRELIARYGQIPFDIERGPLMRVVVLKISDNEHILLMCFHHIIVDQRSLVILNKELSLLYKAFNDGNELELETPAIQFSDYCARQSEKFDSAVDAERLKVWTNRIPSELAPIDLPTDHPRPRNQSFIGRELRTELSEKLSNKVLDVSRKIGTTPFVTTLTAFFALLRRYSRQDVVLVGSPFANRLQDCELREAVGLFVNTLPVPASFSREDSFNSLSKQVNETVVSIASNIDVPLEKIVEVLKPVRHPSFNPLFQVGFTYQDQPETLELDGIDVTDLAVHSGGSMYDVHMWLWGEPDRIGFQIWYDSALFEEETITRFQSHYIQLLEQMLDHPDEAFEQFPLISNTERNLYGQVNATEVATPDEKDLWEYLFASERNWQEARIVSESVRVDYRKLRDESDRIARILSTRDIGPGDFVGVLMSRSVDLLTTLLAVWRSGAAYVPLDPRYPWERINYIVEDSGLKLVIVSDDIEVTALTTSAPVAFFDKLGEGYEVDELGPIQVRADPSQCAYAIYTSGSTGHPKGVAVRRNNVHNFLSTMSSYPGLKADDVLVAVTTVAFDISVLELFLPVLMGASLIIASEDQASDGRSLRQLVEENSATVMQATPSLWRILLDSGWVPSNDFKVLCGGEPFPRSLLRNLLDTTARVFNMYGPTEATVWATCCELADADKAISIGHPIGNTRVYVVDEYDQLQPVGVPGELCIGGACVAAGYINREELTKERFTRNPFSSNDQDTIYRTGDLVRMMSNGTLLHMGRVDNQVKIRGFRIELEEIEARLGDLEGVSDVAVNVWHASQDDHRLVAHVVLSSDIPTTSIRKSLRRMLPDYMIPNHFVTSDKLPRMPNGKIDRGRLPAPEIEKRSVIPPVSELEKQIARIWTELIGNVEIGRFDNFFQAGGHSLLAMKARSLIESEVGVEITLQQLVLENLDVIAKSVEGVGVGPKKPWSKLRKLFSISSYRQ